ncbi:hypothetical protein YYC_04783 [Plasmodium yoelii 17X]|uniref:Uncharacterized protein n=1 Tax=Plasmodium yoelii 17X TaxID=1323249 RepID=V7PCT6_PLAYE|nr:hypothetical protein YYC_04783 [Plasmodium yoelii 17X]
MDAEICKNFLLVRTNFPDQLDSEGKYYFNDDQHFKEYCYKGKCDSPLDKINAGCLYFFNEFFKNYSVFESVAKSNINVVEYIMIWLSYMLSLVKNETNDSLKHFYTTFIKGGDKYTNNINYISGYNGYKDLVDKKLYYLDMDNNIISKFYYAFKTLCNMYSECDGKNKDFTKCSNDAKDFVNKYNELNEDHSITGNVSYSQILCTLSTDYNNLKSKCSDSSSFPEIKTPQNCVKSFEHSYQLISAQNSEVASSSSLIVNKLFIVLSIFGAIGIFLGISYKYSLFGFRKRVQKQYLREKIKNIKKKMNQ